MKIKLVDRLARVVETFDVDPKYIKVNDIIDLDQTGGFAYDGVPISQTVKRVFEQDSEHPHLYLEVGEK